MKPDELLSRRLLLFTGKGGVGKSVVVAAVALMAAKKGKRVLIVEVHTQSAMKRLFNVPFVGFIPLEIADNILAININPEEALIEYIEQHVKSLRIAKLISRNSILQYFFKTAPAVNELVTINKLHNLVHEQNSLGRWAYDMILVDMPSTGHAFGFLDLPRTIRNLVGVGPLRKIVEKYEQLFSDQRHTALNLVTIPEDMPVTETIELYRKVTENIDIPMGLLFVNAVPEKIFDQDEAEFLANLQKLSDEEDFSAALQVGKSALTRQKLSEDHIERLTKAIKMTLVKFPRLLSRNLDMTGLETLADSFGSAMEEAT